MKRRAGALTVDIDMIANYVEITVDQAKVINFLEVEDAVKSAGYQLEDVYIQAVGSVDQSQFIMEGSKQSFSLKSASPVTGPKVAGKIVDFRVPDLSIEVGLKPRKTK